ncbi:MAG TPA: response regulator, partial [Conexibacter sp.]|nr:response regulator [Conexibacter sp.]
MTDDRPMILIVEDDRTTRGFLADNLSADGFEPIAVESVAEALTTLDERYPDIVLLDLGLPDRDGLE